MIDLSENKEVDWKDMYIHLAADHENYKKAKAKELEFAAENGARDVIIKLLPFIDALSLIENNEDEIPYGIFASIKEFERFSESIELAKYGTVGDMFNPNIHMGITVKHTGLMPKGSVIEIVRTGYTLKDKIIRYAEVIVEE